MNMIKYWKPILIALFILYASVTPADNLTKVNLFNIKHLDKIIHFLMYYVFSLTLFASILKNTQLSNIKKMIITLTITISYGLLMESLQYVLTSDRSPEFYDALANTIGSLLAIISFPYLKRFKLSKYL